MRFNKGDFTSIPRIDKLVGIEPIAQTLYIWICYHSDKEGICFPSIKQFAKECGMGETSVRKGIKILEEGGFITRERRFKDGEEITSIYYVIYEGGGSPHEPGGSPSDDGTKSTELYKKYNKKKNQKIELSTEQQKLYIDKIRLINCEIEQEHQLNKETGTVFKRMVELGYYIEPTKENIKEFVLWCKDIMQKYIGLTTIGGFPYATFENRSYEWYIRHKEKGDKITQYKTSLLQFLKPKQK